MIVDNPDSWYIFAFSKKHYDIFDDPAPYLTYRNKRLTNKEYLEHWGKWVFFGEKAELDEMARKLDSYVEEGIIPCIKYDRQPPPWSGRDKCVMCVFCDDREGEMGRILSEFGVQEKRWMYDREVIAKWMPGGEKMEQWIKHRGLNEEQAEKIREDARQRFGNILNNPDDICLPWEQ